jgi:hypothetical protein
MTRRKVQVLQIIAVGIAAVWMATIRLRSSHGFAPLDPLAESRAAFPF